MRLTFLTLFMLVLFVTPALTNPAQDLASAQKDLNQLQRRIEKALKNLDQSKQASANLTKELRRLDRKIDRTDRAVAALADKLAAIKEEKLRSENQLTEVRRKIQQSRQDVERRLVALYKEGDVGPLRIVFSQTSTAELSWQYEYLTRVVNHDRELLERYRAQQKEKQRLLAELDSAKARQEQAYQQQQGRKQLLADARRVKQGVLKKSQKNQQVLAGLVKRLEEREGALSELVKKLESKKTRQYTQDGGPFEEQKGNLDWPVNGTVRVGFGPQKHPELGTTFQSRGLEIDVKPATNVVAVWPGTVAFSDWFSGYGNLIIVDHGEGFHTLYARVSSPLKKRGDAVGKAEPLAVADSRGRVHFEIRKNGKSVNPQKWLSR